MTYATRALQARCAALGFWPGPIDGNHGPRTQGAYEAAGAAQRDKGLPFVHASGISRIHIHWSAGGYDPSADERKHYHEAIDGDAQFHVLNPHLKHLAHTLNANGGTIGIAMCCMDEAVERPFRAGVAPMLARQLSALTRRVAMLCRTYDIPVSPWSTLSHAEVQPTLGIKQRQKWDVCWIPGMAAPGAPVEVGNRIRAMIARDLTSI